ncbi:nitroreductase [Reichenbachiella sp. 5M10]|uniref:nitroreductase family protein n=1 Tax=Reichenbachiella sp. 5M10 TaxID=1889772 RepID=UPI000C14D636|nr:nitroreductase family protein [Reichenbachiella sp. 5M10]PIB36082.1 nitroreductase [Reichenbachiella sp. 5M10]
MKTKDINGFTHVKYAADHYTEEEMLQRSEAFYQWIDRRRSVREISDRSFPRQVLDQIILAASTAPSGAHKQPWTFCVVSNPEIKAKIREASEKEERESYESRMSERWKDDLKPIGTNWHKPFLEKAPYLVILFKRVYELDSEGKKINNYYVNESVGIAAGMFISAVHHAGLVTLTHTPSPMNFLADILGRPANERAYLVLPVGYPDADVYVPDFKRKPLDEVCVNY